MVGSGPPTQQTYVIRPTSAPASKDQERVKRLSSRRSHDRLVRCGLAAPCGARIFPHPRDRLSPWQITLRWFLAWRSDRYAARRRACGTAWSHCLPRCQTMLLRAVPVFHRLPLWSAIFPGPAQGRAGAGRHRGDRRDDRPRRRLCRGPRLQLRPRNRRWRDRRITHGVGDHRHYRRRNIPSGDWRRRAGRDGQQHSGCVCGDLSYRRRRCCVVPGADRASPDGRRPRQGLRRVRGADGWRQSQAAGNCLGLSRHRATGLPCARGQRCHWQARQGHSSRRTLLRRACTPRRPDHRSRTHHHFAGWRHRRHLWPPRGPGAAGRRAIARSRGRGTARCSGRAGGCVRHQSQRGWQDPARTFRVTIRPWRFPAPRAAQQDGAGHLLGFAGAARRYPHFSRRPEAHRRRCPRRRCA